MYREFGEEKTWLLFSWGLCVLADYLLLVFHFFRLAWKMNYLEGGKERSIKHTYCTLGSNDSKRVQVSWDFNLLVKIRHLKTPFQSSFSWCLWTKKLTWEERLFFSKQDCWKLRMKNARNDITSLRNSMSLCKLEMCALNMQLWKLHVSVWDWIMHFMCRQGSFAFKWKKKHFSNGTGRTAAKHSCWLLIIIALLVQSNSFSFWSFEKIFGTYVL